MTDNEVDPKLIDDLDKRAEEQNTQVPDPVDVPLGVSEDEAIQAVKQQFKDADLECTDDEARTIVQAAQEKADKKKAEKKSDDDKSDE